MNSIPSFSKIFQVGSEYVPHLFDGEVEVTEKVDGSQFAFGIDKESNIVIRSKGKEMYFEQHDKMFSLGVEYVRKLTPHLEKLKPGTYFYAEYLQRPRHNVLQYERTPKNNLVLFGVSYEGKYLNDYTRLKKWAESLDIDVVPLLYRGSVKSIDDLNKFLETDSYLGREKVEGVVIKNYHQPAFVGNQIFQSFAKWVRPQFKERHDKDWQRDHSKKGKLETFVESFATEAQWHKAVQHLRDKDELLNEPKDIGALMREIAQDLIWEETENIKKELFKLYRPIIVGRAQRGFPEWYKEQLAKGAFKDAAK